MISYSDKKNYFFANFAMIFLAKKKSNLIPKTFNPIVELGID